MIEDFSVRGANSYLLTISEIGTREYFDLICKVGYLFCFPATYVSRNCMLLMLSVTLVVVLSTLKFGTAPSCHITLILMIQNKESFEVIPLLVRAAFASLCGCCSLTMAGTILTITVFDHLVDQILSVNTTYLRFVNIKVSFSCTELPPLGKGGK